MGDLESLETIIVVKRTDEDAPMQDGRDHWYHELLEKADDECPPEPMDSEDPLFILYSSGSTAKPKGILHTTAGYLTGVAYTHKLVFDLKPEEDVFWCSADVGWITGHSYIVYGPLANGTTSVMFEGAPDYPDKDIWWELIERYGVSLFYTAPTAIRAAMKWGKEYPEKHDLSSLRLLGTVGEPINPKAWLWYHTRHRRRALPDRRHVVADRDRPHHDRPAARASPRRSRGRRPRRCPASTPRSSRRRAGTSPAPTRGCWWCAGRGRGCCGRSTRTTTASSRPTGRRSERTIYTVGDAARKDEDGYFWIIGRTDDVLNVSGHRMSTAEIEGAIVSHDKVAEAAVIGQSDEDSGQAVTAFVTLGGDQDEGDEDLVKEIREHVGKKIGKLARPKRIIWADDLPKTRSGKIMRRLLRDIAEGNEPGDVSTLADPSVVETLEEKVKAEQNGDG